MKNKQMKNKQLKPDGAYGRYLNGYTDLAAAQKAQFLKDGKALLKEVGNWLAARGLTEMDVRVNPSGIAGSGDVYADYWQSDDPTRRAYVDISASALGWGRKDGLIVLARVQHYRQDGGARKPAYRMANSGPNQWLSANFDSKELADKLWQIFCPATSPDSVIAFTASGAQAIPNAIVRNDGEAAAWADGMLSVQHAFAADNEQAIAVPVADVPITLSLFNELEAQQAA
jgi:hypothetical protein